MLSSVKALMGFRLAAIDGEIGSVNDFYFDDKYWAIRYLVANTGTWLSKRLVLISPYSVSSINSPDDSVSIGLSKDQIEKSPSIDTDKPVSRQYEESYYSYYGWPIYWGGPLMWGYYPTLAHGDQANAPSEDIASHWDSHLRSAETVEGYGIQALDGTIGHVSDYIIDEATWAIRYLVIDTRNWWHGKHVLIAPQWADRVSWEESNVYVNVTRETIKSSPEYDPTLPITPEIEERFKKYYESYWSNAGMSMK